MGKYKFVEFSKKTAKKNPDMIIREYDRIISEFNSKIKKIRREFDLYDLHININDIKDEDVLKMKKSLETTRNITLTSSLQSMSSSLVAKKFKEGGKATFGIGSNTGLEFMQLVKQTIDRFEKTIAPIENEMKKVQKELIMFKNKYKKTNMGSTSNRLGLPVGQLHYEM